MQDDSEKCGKLNLNKGNISCAIRLCNQVKRNKSQTSYVLCHHWSRQIQIPKCQVNNTRQEMKVRKTKFLQRAIIQLKVGQTRPKSNLTCIMSRQIQIRNLNSICRKMTKKSPENELLAKGNNSCKIKSNATKVELDLYYVKTNPYTKFQVKISKDDWKS